MLAALVFTAPLRGCLISPAEINYTLCLCVCVCVTKQRSPDTLLTLRAAFSFGWLVIHRAEEVISCAKEHVCLCLCLSLSVCLSLSFFLSLLEIVPKYVYLSHFL